MILGRITIKRRVWVGLGFMLLATTAWWLWTRAKPPTQAAILPAKPAFVRLAGNGSGTDDRILRERAELFDPTPLFFPTEWNYGQSQLPDSLQRQPGQVFENFPPHLTYLEQDIKGYGTEAAAGPERLADVLVQGNESPFGGMGQIDIQRPALPERSCFLEVRGFLDEKDIIQQPLNDIVLPRSDFAPMEFLIVVSTAGVVGEPVLMPGSKWEEVDEEVGAFFRSYLVKTFRIGERLNPGRYRVLIGP